MARLGDGKAVGSPAAARLRARVVVLKSERHVFKRSPVVVNDRAVRDYDQRSRVVLTDRTVRELDWAGLRAQTRADQWVARLAKKGNYDGRSTNSTAIGSEDIEAGSKERIM